MARHAMEIEQLSDRMTHERQQQQLALKERLGKKRAQMVQNLQRKQEAELAKEMITQDKEVQELRTREVCHGALATCIYKK